jgi:hypothetical protein
MHGVGGQAPRTEGRPEYKTEAAEEVIGGQEQETPDDRDINFFFGNRSGFENQHAQEQNPAKFSLARTNAAKSSKEPARSGLAGPIPASGGRSERRGDDKWDQDGRSSERRGDAGDRDG